jgi:hypothetical protein
MVKLNFESFKDFAGDVGSGIKSGIESLGSARYKSGSSLTQEQMDKLENEFYQEELQRLKEMSPDSSDEDLATRAIEIAQKKVQDVKDNELSFFGQMTTPKSLATAGGIIAAILAGRESQRRYDDYMASRPKYDPGQNPYMANGGGIQSFADGNEVRPFSKQSLRDMMIMNMKEKPMSAMIKTMTAIDSPEILMALLGMNQGGGIQGFAKGTPEFPRMTGDIQGPGTGTSDSIPAMLSDGEHVLTKQEVSQIGGGNNDLGHQKLYAMREELRSKAKSNGIGRM